MVARVVAHAGAAIFCAKTSIGCAEATDVAGAPEDDVRMSSGCEVAPPAAEGAGFFEGVVEAEEGFCVEDGVVGGGGDGVCGIVRRPADFASSRW